MKTVKAVRFRHANEDERRLGRTMIPRVITYSLGKAEVLDVLRDAQAMDPAGEGYVQVTVNDVAAAEAGRPIREGLLKSLYGADALAEAFLSEEPDPVADAQDLVKAERETDDVYETVMVVRERIAPREERPLLSYGIMAKSEHQAFIPSVSDLRDRLMAALRAGDVVVKGEDVAMLDGGRIRDAVFRRLYPGVTIEEHSSLESLAKSIAGDNAGSELRRAADELDAIVKSRQAGRG